MKQNKADAIVEAIASRVFARVVEGLARPLTERESQALATACGLLALADPTEAASLEEYTVGRAIELARR